MTNELQGVTLEPATLITHPAVYQGPILGIVAGDHPDTPVVAAPDIPTPAIPAIPAMPAVSPVPALPANDFPDVFQRYQEAEKLFDSLLKEAGFPDHAHGPGQPIVPAGPFNVPNMGPGDAPEPAHFPQPLTVIGPEHVTMDDPTHGF